MKLLLYSADSYGLGHVRRTLGVAERVVRDFSGASARVITGAPRAHYFRYPEGVDYVKIPAVTKDHRGRYVSRNDEWSLGETIYVRSAMIENATALFRPDVVYVDHVAEGLCGEMRPTLNRLRPAPNRPLRLLGMRDIIDEPEVVKRAWQSNGVIETLRRDYDHVLVFGHDSVFDPVRAYGVPDDIARKMTFVGYIPRNGTVANRGELRKRFAPRTGRLVAVTMGGGGDGNVLLRAFLEGFERLGRRPPFEVVAVTGPLMSPGKRGRFKQWAERLDGVQVLDYSPSLPDLIGAADFVVSMAGYNTICELACANARSLLVPRTFPRREQLLRARLLADRGVARFLEPDAASPTSLMAEVLSGLERPRPGVGWGLRLSGLSGTSDVIKRLVRGASPSAIDSTAAAS